MQGYDTTPAKVPARSRTWRTVTECRPHGESWGTLTHTVTLTRTPAGLVAQVNGEAASVRRAVGLLEGATRTEVLSETLETPPIGKAWACELHRELGRLGFRLHYAAASDALGRPVSSFAALSAEDAYVVRNFARGQWGLSA